MKLKNQIEEKEVLVRQVFKVQKKILYAIEAVVDIAMNSGTEPVQNISIAERQGIPKRYLEQTLQELVKSKVLGGSRGPKGGYRLSRERRKIKLSEIVNAVIKEKKLSKEINSDLSAKVIMPLINQVSNNCIEFFEKITVNEICEIAKKKKIQKFSRKKADFVI